MPKFRKKPLEIEAVRWEGPWHQLPGVKVEEVSGDPNSAGGQLVRYYVVTIHGQRAYLAPGEWVIAEPDGIHFYPCADAVFRDRYEEV